MKILSILGALLLFVSAPAYSGYNVDLYGTYIESGKWARMTGGGVGIGVTVIENLSFGYRGMYALSSRKTTNFTRLLFDDELRYNHMAHLAGFEYVLPIPVIMLGWRVSIMAGYSKTHMDAVDMEMNFWQSAVLSSAAPGITGFMNLWKIRHPRDDGAALAVWTGFQFNALPFFAPFVDIGLHKSFYFRGLKGRDRPGINVVFGVRFSGGTDVSY